jgi:hypothetical protein
MLEQGQLADAVEWYVGGIGMASIPCVLGFVSGETHA